MSMQSIQRTAAAMLLGAACVAPALAQGPTGSANISQLSFTLIDLNPSDGIAPEITFGNETLASHALYLAPDGVLKDRWVDAAGPNAFSFPSGSVSASAAPRELHSSSQLDNLGLYAFTHANTSYRADFTLTPFTGVLFSALGDVAAIKGDPNTSVDAKASLFAIVQGPDWKFDGASSFNETLQPDAGSVSYTFHGYIHSGDKLGTGHFLLETDLWTNVHEVTPPVPEPASVAMMLGGLAVVGAAAARRRR
ncbi:MAG: FxDxF family PEP-CTERM protein [Gammaproteobacteria bacterium]